jgi:hypothetical protein
MSEPKTTRCTTCRAEFTDAECEGATACPTCGSDGLPMSIAKDTTVKINPHELRILTMWAMNYAEDCDKRRPGARKMADVVKGIVHALQPQVSAPLSFAAELKQVANTFGPVQVIKDGKVTVIDPDEKN